MITMDQYQEIQRYKALGLAMAKTARAMGIACSSVRKYWRKGPEDFARDAERTRQHLDNYRQYILEQLKLCPQMRDTNIYFKLTEAFPDLSVKRATFYRYMRALREQHGFVSSRTRTTAPREVQPPGYEAQCDFGQYRLRDLYGRMVRVYFFCMVMGYSRMKYVYFSPDPFTTQTAITAHDHAFSYFGGRPQTVLYDLDSVYVVNENLGNIIFVPAFEAYVRKIGYSVSFCRPRDPQSKGKIEEVVGHVKQGFLEGRTYYGIDRLNSDALAWLDREGNGRVHAITRRVPRELYAEEREKLVHVAPRTERTSRVLTLDGDGSVLYGGARYPVLTGRVNARQLVRIEDDGERILVYDPDTNELLAKFPANEDGPACRQSPPQQVERVAPTLARQHFPESETAQAFFDRMKKEQARYYNAHCVRINRMARHYTKAQLLDGIGYCLEKGLCNARELLAYLMARHGADTAKKVLPYQQYYKHLERSREIRREIDG